MDNQKPGRINNIKWTTKKTNTNNDPQNTIQETKNYANKNWRSTQLLWKDIQFVLR
jgi:hypothetical protein